MDLDHVTQSLISDFNTGTDLGSLRTSSVTSQRQQISRFDELNWFRTGVDIQVSK
jgi:hypothetical protein